MVKSKKKQEVTFFEVVRFAFGFWKRQKPKLAVIMTLVISGALAETYLPTSFTNLLESLRTQAGQDDNLHKFALFTLNYFGMVTLFGSCYITYNRFETRLFKQMLDALFIHIHSLSERYFVNAFAGGIISKVNRARNRIESFEDKILLEILPATVILLGSVYFLGLRFPWLAGGLFLYGLLFVAASWGIYLRFAAAHQTAYAEEQDRYVARLADCITGIATTKAYAQEAQEIDRFRERTGTLREKNKRAYMSTNKVWLTQQFMLGGLLLLLVGGGMYLFWTGTAKAEDVVYLMIAYTILRNHFYAIARDLKDLLSASYDLHGPIMLLREQPDIQDVADAKTLTVTHGAISFKNVTFTYPEKKKPVFADFSIDVRAGEHVALVGPSGSGKTSFIRLLQRLYDVQSGSIEIDGQNVAQCTQKSLRDGLGLVPQDPILFHRTLRDNIAYARPDATMEEVEEAARKAYIDDFINSLPDGYDTLVGERGIKLSGGERQRIAIARAILANRPILVLDEATSSLDTLSEQNIRMALRELIEGRTAIMIAHRLSTVLDADRILVFDHGRIVEEGTHSELVAKTGGVYARLFALQSKGFLAS